MEWLWNGATRIYRSEKLNYTKFVTVCPDKFDTPLPLFWSSNNSILFSFVFTSMKRTCKPEAVARISFPTNTRSRISPNFTHLIVDTRIIDYLKLKRKQLISCWYLLCLHRCIIHFSNFLYIKMTYYFAKDNSLKILRQKRPHILTPRSLVA